MKKQMTWLVVLCSVGVIADAQELGLPDSTANTLLLESHTAWDGWGAATDFDFIEQSTPQGDEWEVVTQCRFGEAQPLGECGILLFQDANHWCGVWLMVNADGSDVGVVGGYRMQPAADVTPRNPEFCGDQIHWGVGHGGVWLKIQKTRHGYLGMASLDGRDWFHVGPIVRNPEQDAAEEQVRLFASNPTAAPLRGEFCCVEHAPLKTPSISEGDEFEGDTLNTNLWTVFQGLPSTGKVRVAEGALCLTPSDNQDQWGNIDRALAVYQSAPKASQWSVSAKVAPTSLQGLPPWTGYGLRVVRDQNHWAAIYSTVNLRNHNRVLVAYQFENSRRMVVDATDFFHTALPEYLRIDVDGSHCSCAYSFDGEAWSYLPPRRGVDLGVDLSDSRILLEAKKIDTQPAVLEARFDWVRIENHD